MSLDGTAIVTGGGSGIAQTAFLLLSEGCLRWSSLTWFAGTTLATATEFINAGASHALGIYAAKGFGFYAGG